MASFMKGKVEPHKKTKNQNYENHVFQQTQVS